MKYYTKITELQWDKWDKWYKTFAYLPTVVGVKGDENVWVWWEYYEWRYLSCDKRSFRTIEKRPIPCAKDIKPFRYRYCIMD